jgi:uncharacterized protein YodC (DUF2158 family)
MKHRFSHLAAILTALLALAALNHGLQAQTPADQPVLWASSTEFCDGDFIEVQLMIESGNLNDSETWAWYAGACGAPGTFINFSEVVSWAIGETTTFYAFGTGGPGDLADGPCASITVSAVGPLTAQAGPDQIICAASTFLAAAPPPVGTGLWSVELGVATIADPASPTSAVTGLIPGEEAILRWTVSNGGICEDAFADVSIFSLLPFGAPETGPDQALCGAAETFVTALPDITGLWTVSAGTAFIDNPTSPNTIVSVPVGTTAVLRWTIDDGVCPPVFDEMSITNEAPLAPANAGPDQLICATITTLAAVPPPVGTGLWSVALGVAIIADPSSPTSAVTGLIPGEEAILRWTVSSGGACPEVFDEVSIFSQGSLGDPDAGPDQVLCGADETFVTALPDITGLWTVSAGTAFIDNPTSPNTIVSVPVGTTAVLRWTIDNGICPPAFDEMSITNEAPLAPANAGPDQLICATSTTLAATPPPAGTGQWSVQAGVATIADPASPTSAVTGLIQGEEAVLRWTVSSGGACPEVFGEVSIFSVLPFGAPETGPDQALCNAAETFVTALPDITGLWTVSAGTAFIDNPTSPNTIVSVPVGTTAVLRWTIDDGVCPPAFDEMTITNQAPLAPADAGPDQLICATSTTLAAAIPPAGTGQWSVALGVAIIADPSSPTSAVTGLIPGEQAILRWTVSSGGACPEVFDEVSIFSQGSLGDPDAGPDQALCNAAETFVTALPDITGLWTVSAGTAFIDNPTSPNTIVSVPVGTTAVLRWTIDDGVCPPVFDEMSITNEAPLAPANAGPDQLICATITTLAAVPPPVGTGLWSVALGVAIIADPSSPTSAVTGLIPGEEAILRWTVSSGGACPEVFDEVSIFSQGSLGDPDAGPDQVLCGADETFVTALPDITGLWTVSAGTAFIDNPTSPNTIVSVPVGTTAVLRWTIDNGICPPAFDEMSITNEAPLAPANAGPDQLICATSTTLAATPPPAGTGQWSVQAGVATIADPASPTSAVTGLIQGEEAVLRWTVSSGGACPEVFGEVSIFSVLPFGAPETGPDQALCNAAETFVTALPDITGLWTVSAGTAFIDNPTSPNTIVSVPVGTTAVLRWTIDDGVCPPAFDEMTITNQAPLAPADAGPDQLICATSTTLAAAIPPAGTGQWSVALGVAIIADPSSPTSAVTGLIPGEQAILRWTVSSGGACPEVFDEVSIFSQGSLGDPDAGPDQVLCGADETFVTALPDITGLWTVSAGTAFIDNPTSPNTIVSVPVGTTAVLRWTIDNGICPPAFDEMSITNEAPLAPANAGPDQLICATSTTLAATPPPAGTGQWSVQAGVATIADPASPTSAVTGLIQGEEAVLRWTVSSGGACPEVFGEVSIFSVLPFGAPETGPDQALCNAAETFVTALPDITGLWTVSAGTAFIDNPTSPNTIVSVPVGTTAVLRWTIDDGVCPPAFDEMTITNQAPLAPADAGPDQLICATSTTLAAAIPPAGTGQWSVALGVAIIADPSSPTSAVTGLIPGEQAILRWTVSSGGACPEVFDEVSIFSQGSLGDPDAGPDQALCNAAETFVTALPDITGLWTVSAGTAFIDNPTSPNTIVSVPVGTTAVLRWTIDNGVCPPAFDEMTITNEAPLAPANAGPDQLICATSTTLAATPPPAGTGQWSVQAGVATIADPASPTSAVTGLIQGEEAVLRWTVSSGGACPEVFGEVSIFSVLPFGAPETGPDQALCNAAETFVTALPDITGLWTVSAGTAFIDNPTSPNTIVSVPVGTTAVLRWTIDNGVCPPAFDEMTITNEAPLAPANAGPDQLICATSTTLAATPPPAGTGQWSVQAGVATIADPASPTSAVTGLIQGEEAVLRWTVSSGGACPEVFGEVSIFSVLPFGAPETGPDQALCNAAETFVTALPDITGLWTVSAGTAFIDNPTSPNTIVSVPVGTTAVLRWTIDDGICPPAFDEMTITNQAPLAPADAGPDQLICATITTLAAVPPPVGTGLWSVALGVAIIADPSSPTSAVTGLIPGEEAILRWTVSSGGACPEVFDEVSIFSQGSLGDPDAGPDQVLCGADETFVTALPDVTGLWTVTAGAATIDNPTSPNTIVSVPVGTTAVLRWTIDDGICPPAFDEMTITNQAPLAPADAGPDQLICATITTLAAVPPPVGTGLWSVALGVAIIADPSSPTSAVTGLIPGEEAILRWTVSSGGACPEVFDEVSIFSQGSLGDPDAGPDQVLCGADETFVTALPDVTGLWTVTAGAATIDNPTSPNTIVSVPLGTTAVLRWTIDNGVCPPAFDEMTITNEAPLAPANAGPDQLICATSTTLAATPPPAGTGQWSVQAGVATIADPASPTSAVTGLIQGEEAVLRWTVSSGGACPEVFGEVSIFSVLPFGAPETGPDQALCNAAETFVTALPDITGLWTVSAGTAFIDNPTSPNTIVSVPVGTTAVLRWTIDDGVCPPAFDEMTITNQAPLAPADAGPDQLICATSTTLAAAIPPAGTGQWSVALGVAIIADPSSPTSAVTGLIPGEQAILRWTVSSGGACPEVFDEVSIFSQGSLGDPDAGPDQVLCGADETFVTALPDVTGLWTVTAGAATIDNPTSPNTIVSVPVGTTAVLRWTIDDGVCPPAFDEMSITNEAPLAPANAGPDQLICATSTTLAATPPPVGTGLWSVAMGVAIIADPASPTSAVTGLIQGEEAVLRWTVSSGGACPEVFDEVSIFSQGSLGDPDAGPDQVLCGADETFVTALPDVTGLWTVTAGAATIDNPTSPNTIVSVPVGTTAVLRWTIDDGVCPPAFDEMTITNQAPLAPADAGPDQLICATITTLAAVPPPVGTGLWSVALGVAIIADPSSPTSAVTGLIPGEEAVLRWTVSSGGACPEVFGEVSIFSVLPFGAPETGPDQALCNAAETFVTALPDITGLWTVSAGTAFIDNPTSPNTIVSVPVGTTAVLRWTIDNGICPPAFDEMTITNEAPLAPANAGPDQLICATSTTLAATPPPAGTGQWSVQAGVATIADPASPTSAVTGLIQGEEAVLRWTVSSGGACPEVFGEVSIFSVLPFGAPETGPDQALCNAAETFVTALPDITGLWTVSAGTAFIDNPTSPNTIVSVPVGTTAVLRWTIDNGICPPAFDEMTITNEAPLAPANAGPDQLICATITTLAAVPPPVGTGLWSVALGVAIIADPSSPTSAVTGLIPGEQAILRWTVSSGGACPEVFDEVSIFSQGSLGDPDAGPDQVLCGADETFVTALPDVTGLWTVTAGAATIDNPTSPNTIVSVPVGTTAVLRWTIDNGVCPPAFDEMTITNQAPLAPANAGPDQLICATSTTLAATPPPAGTGQWSVQAGVATIADPASPTSAVTGLIQGEEAVLRWTVSSGGACPEVFGEVSIFSVLPFGAPETGPDQALCNAAETFVTALPDITGLWTVSAGTAFIDNPTSPNTIVSVPVGTTAVLRWTIDDGVCPPAFDEMTITNQAPLAPADAGPDQLICATITTLAAVPPPVGTGLWSVALGVAIIADPSSPTSAVTGLIPGEEAILRWTVSSGGACPEVFGEVSIFSVLPFGAPETGPDQALCNAAETFVTALPDITGLWTVSAGTAFIDNPTSPNTIVSVPVGTTAVLRWTIDDGICPPAFDEMTITNDAPPLAIAGSDQELCGESQTSLNAIPPTAGTGIWSLISGTANIVNPTAPNSLLNNLPIDGSVILRWTVSNGVCPDDIDELVITNSAFSAAIAGADQLLCNQAQTSLGATPPDFGTGQWSIVSGTATIADPAAANSFLNNLPADGAVILRWTVNNGACPEVFDEVNITNNAIPSAAAGPGQALCNQTQTILNAAPVSFGTGQWSLLSGTAAIADPADPASLLTGLPADGTVTLRWTASNGVCPEAFDEITITNYGLPTAAVGPDQELCGQTAAIITAAAPAFGTGSWSVASGPGIIPDPTLPVTDVIGLVPGQSSVILWTVSNGVCPEASAETAITVFEQPIADAGTSQELCNQTQTSLNAALPNAGTGQWSLLSGTAAIADPADPASLLTGLPADGTVTLRWTASNGVCPEAFDEITITNYGLPAAAVGPDQELCGQTAAIITAAVPAFGTGSWSLASGPGIIPNPALPVTDVIGLAPGQSSVILWTVSNGVCPEASAETAITVFEQPIADAGTSQELCNQTQTSLNAALPNAGTGQWSLLSGTAAIADPADPASLLTGLPADGTVTLRWTASNGVCPEAFDEITITNYGLPAAAVGPDQELCGQTAAIITAAVPAFGTGSWSLASGPGIIPNPALPVTDVIGLAPGQSSVFLWTVSNGVCPEASAETAITVFEQPIADASTSQELCNQTQTSLNAALPNAGTGQWSLLSGTAVIADPADPASLLTGLPADGTVTLRWTASNGVCPEDFDDITIANYGLPTAAVGADQELCGQTAAIITAAAPAFGTGSWSVASGPGIIPDPTLPATDVIGLAPGQSSVFRWTVSNGVCPEASAETAITVFEQPIADAGTSQELCNQTQTSLNAALPNAGTGQWSLLSGTAVIADPADPASLLTGLLADGTVVLRWTASNGVCPEAFDEITIANYGLPGPATVDNDQQLCDQTIASISAQTPLFGAGTWSVTSGPGIITAPSVATTDVSELIPGQTSIFRWTVTNGICPAATADLTIQVFEQPVADAGIDQELCAQTLTTLNATQPNAGTGMWSLVNGMAAIADPTEPASLLTSLPADGIVVLRWTVNNGICPEEFDEVSIANFGLPVASVSPAQELCNQATAILSATAPLFGTGNWSVISGPGSIANSAQASTDVIGLVPGQSTVFLWTVSNGACPEASAETAITVFEQPVADAGASQELCNQTQTALDAAQPNAGVGQWSLVSGIAAIADPADPASLLTGLPADGTVVLRWTASNGICPEATDEVSITNYGLPTVAVGPGQELCGQAAANINAETPAFGTGSWSVVSGPGAVSAPSQPSTDVTGLVPGQTSVFRWTVSNGVCPEAVAETAIEVFEVPSLAALETSEIERCGPGEFQIIALEPQAGMGQWSVVAGDDVFIGNEQSAFTSAFVGDLEVPVVFRWTVSNGPCPSSFADLNIYVYAEPESAEAGIDQELCGQSQTMLSATPPLVGSGQWSIASGGGVIADTDAANSLLTGLPVDGSLTLRWTVSNGVCPPEEDEVSITNYSLPSLAFAGPDEQLCAGADNVLQAAPILIGNGQWSVVSGTATIAELSNPASALTGLLPDETVILRWVVSNGVCPSSVDEVTLDIIANPDQAFAGEPLALCDAAETTLAASPSTIGTGTWSIISGTAVIAQPGNPASLLSGLIPGQEVQLRWTVTNGVCAPVSDELQISNDALPGPAFAGEDLQACNQSEFLLTAGAPTVGTGAWSIGAGDVSLTPAGALSVQVSGLNSDQSATLRWTVSNGACPPVFDELSLQNDALPSPAIAGLDQEWCAQAEGTLNALPPLIGSGQWTLLSGMLTVEEPGNPFSAYRDLPEDMPVVLRWTVSNGICPPSTSELSLTNYAPPSLAVAGPDQALCDSPEVELAATPPQSGLGLWSVVAGAAEIANPAEANAQVTGLMAGLSAVLRWTVSNGVCPAEADEVVITVDELPSPAIAGADLALCDEAETLLDAVPPAIGTGQWHLLSGQATLDVPAAPNALLSGLIAGTAAVLVWEVQNGVCPASRDTIHVANFEAGLEVLSNFLIAASACAGDSIHLIDISEQLAPGLSYLWDFGDGNTSNERDPVHVYQQPGTYQINLRVEAGGCALFEATKSIFVMACRLIEEDSAFGGLSPLLSAEAYPNPSRGDFRLTAELRRPSSATIRLYDLQGRLLEERQRDEAAQLNEDFSLREAGLYFVQLMVAGQSWVFKVVVVGE